MAGEPGWIHSQIFCIYHYCYIFFFFQAEDGIRDHCVTGVQTCALPISVGIPLLVLDRLAPLHHRRQLGRPRDRKSTRLNSSHTVISYAVFCLKKKKMEPMRKHRKKPENNAEIPNTQRAPQATTANTYTS